MVMIRFLTDWLTRREPCLELQITLSSTDCRLVTMMTDLDRGYLTKISTFLARLFCLV